MRGSKVAAPVEQYTYTLPDVGLTVIGDPEIVADHVR
jgi:hypothetical protein